MEPIESVAKLQKIYKKLPSIGGKTAERLAYATLGFSEEQIDDFIKTLIDVKNNIHPCPKCNMFIDSEKCPVCDDEKRDKSTILVVSSQKSMMAFEKSGTYFGQYYILNGSISPSKGIFPDDINYNNLIKKIEEQTIQEVILATDPTLEGETTSLFLSKIIAKLGNVKVTRLAYGLPMGANIDYLDALTLSKSIKGRQVIEEGNK